MTDIDHLLHHFAAIPPVFLEEPILGRAGTVDVAAVLGDVYEAIGAEPPGRAILGPDPDAPASRNRLRVLLITAWVVWGIREHTDAAALTTLLTHGLSELASLVEADRFARDPDRQEELVRTVLAALRLQPAGETAVQSADRLQGLSTVHRTRIIRAQQDKLERARKLKAELDKKRREEAAAAARYHRE